MTEPKDTRTMNRRKALGVVATAGAAAAASTLPKPAIAQENPAVNWRMTSSFPPSLKALQKGTRLMLDRIAEATGGKFQIQFFSPGEIVGGLQAFDAVKSGTVECCHTAPYFYVGQDPTFAFGTALPFGLNTRQHNTWIHSAGGKELLQAFFDRYEVTYIPYGNTCAQAAGWFRKEIKTADDFKGLKMRIPGIAGQVLGKLGGVPQQIAPGDIYSALERGTIDAAELSGPYDDESTGLNKVTQFYYYPGWQEVCAGTSIFVNNAAWNGIPEHYKAALLAASAEGERMMMAEYDVGNMAALRRLAGIGVNFKRFPQEVLLALFNSTQEYVDETKASNADFAKVYEHWSAFRKDINLWFGIAETPNDTFIQNALRG